MSTGTDVAKLDEMVELLFADAPIEVVSSEEIQLDMVRRIMQAETLEEAMADFTATPLERYEGVPIKVLGVRWAKSAYEAGSPIYAFMTVQVSGDNKIDVVSCGGATVVTRLRWAELHDQYPFSARFVRVQSQQNPEFKYWSVEDVVKVKK